jgi:hypothetical protein
MEAQNTTTKTPTPRADQDQLIANRIADTRRKINAVQGDDDLKTRFATRGCDLADLTVGLGHCDSTQAGYDARQVALGKEKAAYKILAEKRKVARSAFAELRALAKLAYPRDKASQQALRATGRVPLDDDTFLTDARAAGHSAGQAPYAADLTRRGYNPATYTAALNDFDTARNTARAAADAAVSATAQRDTADKELQTWLLTFEGIIALELKRDPHLATRLG